MDTRWNYFVTITFKDEKIRNLSPIVGLRKTLKTIFRLFKKHCEWFELVVEWNDSNHIHYHANYLALNNYHRVTMINKFKRFGNTKNEKIKNYADTKKYLKKDLSVIQTIINKYWNKDYKKSYFVFDREDYDFIEKITKIKIKKEIPLTDKMLYKLFNK